LPSASYEVDSSKHLTTAATDDLGSRFQNKHGLIVKKNVTSLAEMLGFKHLQKKHA
jgi:hypothetical protein